MNIYLAGPDIFLVDADEIGARKSALCKQYGASGLYPLDNKIDAAAPDASMQIFRANQALMDSANVIIANLTPFRGPSADPGTVYELGYMAGRGKRCFGYCNVAMSYADRVSGSGTVAADGDLIFDKSGLIVENFGHADNLMMIHALDVYGAPLIMPPLTPLDVWRDLTCFEECLKLATSS